jgi:hypothetical protein
MTPLMATMAVAAMTKYDPHAKCGINRRTSTKRAKRQTKKVMTVKMKKKRRYLEEWPGL